MFKFEAVRRFLYLRGFPSPSPSVHRGFRVLVNPSDRLTIPAVLNSGKQIHQTSNAQLLPTSGQNARATVKTGEGVLQWRIHPINAPKPTRDQAIFKKSGYFGGG
jgi:hypothetical protein